MKNRSSIALAVIASFGIGDKYAKFRVVAVEGR